MFPKYFARPQWPDYDAEIGEKSTQVSPIVQIFCVQFNKNT
jgi:hypothetical protein